MATSVNEPTVSVHGVPQSQYNAGGVPGPSNGPPQAGGGGITGFVERHPVAIGVVVTAIAIGITLYFSSANSSNSTSTGKDSSTGLPTDYGSQIDADLQQLGSTNNQILGMLQNYSNQSSQNSQNNPSPNPLNNQPPLANGIFRDRNHMNNWQDVQLNKIINYQGQASPVPGSSSINYVYPGYMHPIV